MADRDDDLPAGEADDHFHDECGVFGIFGRQDAAAIATLGLHSLQHRGQEAAGIVSYDGSQFHVERHVGLIGDTFTKQAVIDRLQGTRAIGHTRYATTGGAGLRNVQPFFAELADGGLAVAHNGNITNALTVQRSLQKQGAIFSSTSDTETILHLVATSKERDLNARFIEAIRQIEGAFSLVALTSKKMIGVRDPLGIRPLVLGDLDGAWILASETCALDIIGARFVRDLKPGEMVVVTSRGIESLFPFEPQKSRFCIFEYVYFARPDSSVEGRNVYAIRKKIGAELALESPVEADIVVPVPDFGHAGGHRLLAAGWHSLRARHHPQPLCRPHLHPARQFHPPHGRQAEAQRQPAHHRGQAGGAGRQFDRARHDQPEDRADGARGGRP